MHGFVSILILYDEPMLKTNGWSFSLEKEGRTQ